MVGTTQHIEKVANKASQLVIEKCPKLKSIFVGGQGLGANGAAAFTIHLDSKVNEKRVKRLIRE